MDEEKLKAVSERVEELKKQVAAFRQETRRGKDLGNQIQSITAECSWLLDEVERNLKILKES